MRNGGYTEIASASDETDPLTSRSHSHANPAVRVLRESCGRKVLATALSVGAGLLLGFLLMASFVQEEKGESILTSNKGSDEEILIPENQASHLVEESPVMYRPICESYAVADSSSSTPSVTRLIQTSMMEPNLQWSQVPCYHQPPLSDTFFHHQNHQEAHLNTFGAPDAILQVNFSQLAHPDRHVPILGFGGAFTEASALNFNRLSQKGKEAVMELLFGATGLGYSLGRFHINSCDFSVQSYSFDETEDDFDLINFDVGVQHDVESGMVDMALRAVSVFRDAWSKNDGTDGTLLLFASPWSPPSWMKKPTDHDWENATHAAGMTYSAQPNCLREGVGPQSRYAKAWALYFSKFLTSYQNLGLPLWGVTVQNEPEFPAPWEACSYTPETEMDFVANHLGPQLRKDHPSVKIFAFDHNKDHIVTWAKALLNSSSTAAKYIDGTAYHWYAGGMDRLLDGALGIVNLHHLQEDLEVYGVKQDHIVLGSESCHCPTTGYAGGDINIYWSRAERYAHTVLADLAAGSNGWVEWNLILDGIGGPNHLGNLCEASLLAVPHRAADAGSEISPLPDFEHSKPFGNTIIGDGRTREELDALGFPAQLLDLGIAVQPLYYYMGHISRYVRPGSVAVMALVNQNLGPGKIFRPPGSVVAGGGMNDLARIGIELTVWPCEGSTRQQFRWNVNDRKHITVFGHDWLGNPTQSCIARAVDPDFLGLRLTDCFEGEAGQFDAKPLVAEVPGYFNVILRNHPKKSGLCLVIRQLKNGGGAYGPRGGAQLSLGDCSHESAKWKLDQLTGEAISSYFSDESGEQEVCLTTGWPFLQIGAFLTPNGVGAKTVVVLNEARASANYGLRDNDHVLTTGSIPPRSIQTILLD